MARDYALSVADSATHAPAAPERTARRELPASWRVQYRVWPTVEAMARAMRTRAWRTEGWRACKVPARACSVCGAPTPSTGAYSRSVPALCSDECWFENARRELALG